MRVQIHIENINETIEAPDAAALLHRVKQMAAAKAPFLIRGVINGMGDMRFAGEAVSRANSATGRHDPTPATPEDFLAWSRDRGYVTVLEAS